MSAARIPAGPHGLPPKNRSADRRRAWTGPALLGAGFRPFFLGAALWAALAMALWIAMLAGGLDLPTGFAPIDWHVHEMLYGYLPGVLAGFLLTAIPNWTGRLPVVGWPLLGLFLLWLAGRLAVAGSALVGAPVAAVVDGAFLPVLVLVAAREIAAGRNWRNLPVLAAVLLLAAGNLLFHRQAEGGAAAQGVGARLGLATAVFLVILIGGRIVPSFTRNWLARRGLGRLPAPAGRVDIGALALGGAALVAWTLAPESRAAGAAAVAAGLLHLWRLGRWAGWRTAGEPLVAILHVAYLFAPTGFLLVGMSALDPALVPASVGIHAWTAGLVGTMTVAVMTRASLGHTGRPLAASPAITAIYAAIVAAAVLRVAAALMPQSLSPGLTLSGQIWIAAFAGFCVVLGGPLVRRRLH